MKKEDIKNKLAAIRNGAYTNITFLSDIISNKDNKEHKIQKVVSAVVRLGVTYSHINTAAIQERNAMLDDLGNPVTEKLPWGEWDPECRYLIAHKGNYYLRCTVSRSPKHQRSVKYLLDGVEVTKEDVMALTRASEWDRKEEFVFNPKIENILTLGKGGI